MRPLALVLSLGLFLQAASALATETVVYVDTRGDNLLLPDANYLENLRGNERVVSASIARKADARQFKVAVHYLGPLHDDELKQLLQMALSDSVGPSSKKNKLYVSVRGDKHRVSIEVGVVCGLLCGGSVSHLYTFDGGAWRYLYSYNHTIS